MKTKNILTAALFVMTSLTAFSQLPPEPTTGDPLPLGILGPGDDNVPIGGNPCPKSPIQIPEVYLTGNALSFDATIEGCEVRLLNENKNVVFTDFIEENQTILNFPSTLTGTFELRIIQGNIIFYCEIEL